MQAPSQGSPAAIQQRNARSVVIDGLGVGLVTGVSTFLPVYLVRLGAPPYLVGLLTALPAFTGILLAIAVGRALERQRNMVPAYSLARSLVQWSYVVMGIVPFLVDHTLAAWVTVAIWALVTIPQTVVGITFTVVMGAVVGPGERQALMSRRWSVLGITSAITVALVGLVLDRVAFPLNYQLVFIASFAGGMLSFLASRQITIPDNRPPAEDARDGGGMRGIVATLRANPPFGRFVAAAFVFNLGLVMAIPLFPLYWVRQLGASDAAIGLINMVNSGIVMLGYFVWTALTRRRGNVLVLQISAFGLTLYPLLTALASDIAPIVAFAAIAGIFGAGINLVLFDISLATVPADKVASSIAVYQLTTHAATLVAPMIGTFLGDQLGYGVALLIAAALRLVGAILFVALRVGAPEPRPAREGGSDG